MTTAVRRRPLIVVADDEPDALRLVTLVLTRADLTVMTAVGGGGALEPIRSEAPYVCVLDVSMPPPSGLEMVGALHAESVTAGRPMVLLTAAARHADRVAGREAGADVYLTRPFSPGALVARVRALLEGGPAPAPGGRA